MKNYLILIVWAMTAPVIGLLAIKYAIMNGIVPSDVPAWAITVAFFAWCFGTLGLLGKKFINDVYKA